MHAPTEPTAAKPTPAGEIIHYNFARPPFEVELGALVGILEDAAAKRGRAASLNITMPSGRVLKIVAHPSIRTVLASVSAGCSGCEHQPTPANQP